MKISTSKVALMGFALLTTLVLVWFAGRTEDPVSGTVSTGPTTTAPATAPAVHAPRVHGPHRPRAPSDDPTTPPPAKLTATAVPSRVVSVRPRLENIGFSGSGDVSDDAAIWVDSANPGRSVVIANSKDEDDGGIGVFDMNGKLIQFNREGEIGNVDLRTEFPAGKNSVVLVGANNRSTNTLALWTLDTKTRNLSTVNDRSIKTMSANYGFCLYHSKASGKFYAFVTPEDEGFIQQFELLPRTSGMIDAKVVQEDSDQRYGRGLRRGRRQGQALCGARRGRDLEVRGGTGQRVRPGLG